MHLEIYAYINIPKSGHVHKPYTHAFLRQCIYIKFLILPLHQCKTKMTLSPTDIYSCFLNCNSFSLNCFTLFQIKLYFSFPLKEMKT